MTTDYITTPLTPAQQMVRDMLTLRNPDRFSFHESFGRPGLYYVYDCVRALHYTVAPDVDAAALLELLS